MTINRWKEFPFAVQMSHIGGDVVRSVRWKEKNKKSLQIQAMYRALELIELSLQTQLTQPQCKEVCRMKELFVDFVFGENIHQSTAKSWYNYFRLFDILASSLRNLE